MPTKKSLASTSTSKKSVSVSPVKRESKEKKIVKKENTVKPKSIKKKIVKKDVKSEPYTSKRAQRREADEAKLTLKVPQILRIVKRAGISRFSRKNVQPIRNFTRNFSKRLLSVAMAYTRSRGKRNIIGADIENASKHIFRSVL
jgi:histone H3/H4